MTKKTKYTRTSLWVVIHHQSHRVRINSELVDVWVCVQAHFETFVHGCESDRFSRKAAACIEIRYTLTLLSKAVETHRPCISDLLHNLLNHQSLQTQSSSSQQHMHRLQTTSGVLSRRSSHLYGGFTTTISNILQRLPSLDNIKRSGSGIKVTFLLSNSIRTASWSGSFNSSFTSPTGPSPFKLSPLKSSSSNSLGEELQGVELSAEICNIKKFCSL
ncbi:LOW QUALITY PROTEIN: hypothetical protein YC2023_084954 [Brassica napus]